MCKNLLSDGPHTIRTVASAVGCIIAALPGVKYGGLYYRHLKRCKNFALKRAKGNYGKPINLTMRVKQDLSWWSHNLMFASHFIHTPPVLYTLFCPSGCGQKTNIIGSPLPTSQLLTTL